MFKSLCHGITKAQQSTCCSPGTSYLFLPTRVFPDDLSVSQYDHAPVFVTEKILHVSRLHLLEVDTGITDPVFEIHTICMLAWDGAVGGPC